MTLTMMPCHAAYSDDADAASIELMWLSESASESGWEATMKYRITSDLEVALSTSTIRDTSEMPPEKINGVGLEFSWWPISVSQDINLGLGVTLSDGEKSVSNGRDVTVMLEGELQVFEYQWDVGYDYSRSGTERESAWGTAFSVKIDLTLRSELELELSKSAGEKPSVEVGYEYDATKHLALKLSVGRQYETTFYGFGFEYKF